MIKLGRVLGVVGLVALLSVPLTLFLWDWEVTWVALAKLVFGLAAIGFWLGTNFGGIKTTFQGRSSFYGGFTVLFTAIAVAAVVLANYIFYKHPLQIDLTENEIFSLSDQSLRLLEGLQEDVRILAFYGPKERKYDTLGSFLERYRYASARFVYEFVDPVDRQDLVAQYKIHKGGPRIIVRYGDREERVKLSDKEHSGPEEAITTALLKVTADAEKKRACFLTGHGEKALEGEDPRSILSLFVRDMQAEGYVTDSISLLQEPGVPPACMVVVLAGPERDLTEGELGSLGAFLEGGGRLMAFMGSTDTASLNPVLARYGIELGNDIVVYPKSRSPVYVVTDPRRYPGTHPVFSRFFRSGRIVLRELQAVFPMSRSVGRSPGKHEDFVVTELAGSSANAWGETDPVEEGETITFDKERDLPGPVPLVMAVEAKTHGHAPDRKIGTRLVVFGSSLMVTDSAYRVYPFNRDLIMNTLAWLTHTEKEITIRPRFRAASLLRLSQSQMKFITFFSTDILPLLILAIGITIWQVRRWS